VNTFVRFSVIALVLAGAVASTKISAEPKLSAKVSAMPVPTCPPDGSTDCGIGDVFGNNNLR
jgi:hypothetical protein